MASVQNQAAVISQTANYPGIDNATIARRVGLRDVKQYGTPLAKGTIKTNRLGASIRPGDIIKLSWDDYGIDTMICRVFGVNTGSLKDGTVTINFTQDVFTLPQTTYISSQPPQWTEPVVDPIAVVNQRLVETPYWDIARTFSAGDLAAVSSLSAYAQLIAQKPPIATPDYELWVNAGGGYADTGVLGIYSPTVTINGALGISEGPDIIDVNGIDLQVLNVAIGTYAIINDEYVRIDNIDEVNSQITIGRGCLDTYPASHADGSIIYFADGKNGDPNTEYLDGDSLAAKALVNTGIGRLDIGDAIESTITLDARQNKPYPPGNVKINGGYYPSSTTGSVDFTWAHRDRELQTASIEDFTSGDIGPETGTTYNIRIYDELDSEVENQTGITGNSYSWNPSSLSGGEYEPIDMVFSKAHDSDYIEFLPANLIDAEEDFASDTGQFTKYTEGVPGTTSLVSNTYQISHSGAQNDIVALNTASLSMPQFWSEVTVNVTTASATGYDNGGVGIVKDANNFLFASMDRLASVVRVQIKIAGSNTFTASVSQSFGTSFKLGLSLVGNSATVWVDTGSGWVYKTGANLSGIYNFKAVGALTGWNPGFTLASGGGTSVWRFSDFNFGRYGGVGMRDQTIVTNEDGTPYRPTADTVMFSATIPDMRGIAFAAVFTLDLTDYSYTMDSVIMVERGGNIQNDLVPHIIYYGSGDRRVTIGTWGNGFGGTIEVLHKLETSLDLLVGTNVIQSMTALSLPNVGSGGAYDSMMVYDSDNSRWLIAYTITDDTNFAGNPFYAAAAYSTDLSSWTALGADSSNNGYEGTKIIFANDQYFIIAGGPAGTGDSSRVYDSSMSYLGTLDIVFEGGTSTQPHPMVLPYDDKQICLTFDDSKQGTANFTWGNIQIFEAPRYTPTSGMFTVEIESERDGEVSWQKFTHSWEVTP
jgi:hypothetical protein